MRQWFNKLEKFYAEAKEAKHADVQSELIIDIFIDSMRQTHPQ